MANDQSASGWESSDDHLPGAEPAGPDFVLPDPRSAEQTPVPTPAPPDSRGAQGPKISPKLAGILVAAVIGAVVIGVVGYAVASSPGGNKPFGADEPVRMEGPGFTFTAPVGWARSEDWGKANDAKIVDRAGNDITVYSWPGTAAADRCRRELKSLQIWEPGEIADVAEREVGGKPAPGGELRGEKVYVLRCVEVDGRIYNSSSESDPSDEEEVAQAYGAVLDSWEWK